MFRPGDEVVCVDASSITPIPTGLEEGRVYTVVEVGSDLGSSALDGTTAGYSVWLREARGFYGQGAYDSRRFRKVQRRKTDLSIESFLTIKPGYEEPKRVTTPQKEKVS